ncbi:MAG TPA: hypothetical protein VMH91_03820 [Candidatus Paceibacterota bacterium]|nr:hypothetical protein [Candidatus Paceibacterota bacterium]
MAKAKSTSRPSQEPKGPAPQTAAPQSILARVVLTVVSLFVYGWVMMAYNPQATLITSEVAGRQFDNSDQSYLKAVYTMNFFSSLSVVLSLAILVVLILIWFKPIRDAVKNASTQLVVLVAAGALLLGSAHNSYAFFNKTDRTEVIPIPPNWSAFWIPGFGANKDNQAQMNSEDYLNTPMDPNNPSKGGKVAAKYFQIPHQKLTNSAGNSFFSGYDYFTNTGVLILVDRTRYSQEWTKPDRGTNVQADERFPCQSNDGINIKASVSVGAHVTEANAAKFLYNFGVNAAKPYKPTGDIESDGQQVFQSVQYGRSLSEVMDDVGRKQVQVLVCSEIGKRTFDQAHLEWIEIQEDVKKGTIAYFDPLGVSIDFLGWADTAEFDPPVQDAVNRKYIAMQDEDIAKRLQPYAEIIQMLAQAQAVRSFGDHTDGKLPTTFVGPAPAVASPLLSMPGALKAPAAK